MARGRGASNMGAMIRSIALRAHRVLAWTLVAGIGAQLLVAVFGLFVVVGGRGYLAHATAGRLLAALPLLLLATALIAGVDRRGIALVLGLIGLVGVQIGLVMAAHAGLSAAMALHPLNAGLLLIGAGIVAGRADGYDLAPTPSLPRSDRGVAGVGAAAV